MPVMTTLADCKKGDRGTIAAIAKQNLAYRRKLLAMGLTPGIQFEVVRVAPLGDPVEIRLRGYELSLRKQEASIIAVSA